MESLSSPVTLIAFNRPAHTARVLARIREARPHTLLIISDGPRSDHPADAGLVAETRALIDAAIDWPCEIHRNYSNTNLGCMRRIQTGLDWVFSTVPESIILEDDCLPSPDFFYFCHTLLARYRDDTRIASISGTNLIARHHRPRHAYFFSNHHWIWGWATWRRAWRDYDPTFSTWNVRQPELRASFANAWERQFWLSTFDRARRTLADTNTWDYQWNYTNRTFGRLTAIPRANLIENTGFDATSTHSVTHSAHLRIPVTPLGTLTHPPRIAASRHTDSLWSRLYSGQPVTRASSLRNCLANLADTFTARSATLPM